MEVEPIIIAAISSFGGVTAGYIAAQKGVKSADITASVSKDEVILDHYDKIVDQLQEEVARLRIENDDLQRRNLELEKSLFQTNKQMFELTREMNDLKALVQRNVK